jgi:hypothetical protein
MSFSLRMTYHLILGSVGTREVRRWLIVLYLSVSFLGPALASKTPALAWPEVRS